MSMILIKIAKFKYPMNKHSLYSTQNSCLRAYAPDSLNPGTIDGQTWWGLTAFEGSCGMEESKNWWIEMFSNGMKQILEEWRVKTSTLKADDMQIILANHHDFCSEKTKIEYFLNNEGLREKIFLPKFYCKLNSIRGGEGCGDRQKIFQGKQFFKTLIQQQTIINPASNSVSMDLLCKYFRRV